METVKSFNSPLASIQVRPIKRSEEARYQALMAAHHYLGAVPRIGETLWYVATWQDQWVALISMSGAALKCAVRDLWIGLDFRSQYGRLRLHHYKIPSWNCKVWSASSTNTLLVI
ncbi:MAG: hypothetical protein ACYC2J_07500 [Acidithiobacillus ferrooxidans]|jgi:hypothetical protein|nr:DUF4338 domain-containing protein [Acidithiobacillus sp.]